MKTLSIGDLKARIPIIQGGMGVGISLSGLASAVGGASPAHCTEQVPVAIFGSDGTCSVIFELA